jgi:hypothetical protein
VPNRIELASGEIAPDARISVELNPSEDRAACLIIWPRKPTAVSPAKLAGCVAATCRVLSNAVLELAARRGRKGW